MRVYPKILCIILAMVIMTGLATAYPRKIILSDIRYSELTKDTQKQIDCLAENIYHEAGYETDEGKAAVALVTLNRTQDPRYPKDICSVVKQKINLVCQFSWVCMAVNLKKNTQAYKDSLETAIYVYVNYENIEDVTKGALYYHATYVNPGWKLQRTVVIGQHIFYKEGGKHNDAKTKSISKGRQLEAFVLSDDGGDNT